ncbi:MAG: cytochrome c [candidate division WOR-3 bacterium]|nr:cytochrome c [candidate division WOR-3 bacterium]MCX7947225.1 cytochrome c [candidate division WOR-3 bacterium]MDW8150280.1 cytochrome c [candidate division WOR-3 bacterium]
MKKLTLTLILTSLIACGGQGKQEEKKTEEKSTQTEVVDIVQKGEKLFQTKGCAGCHYPDKEKNHKLVGPGLKGVTKERTEEWLIAMIVNPDSMLKHDEEAKKQLKEYGTPMPNQNVSVEEAKAIIAYLRKISGG